MSLLVDALKCRNKARPPIWFMRQAGRYLPEYRALRAKHSFLEMCQKPELVVEVTKLPIDKIGFDAAILFSDILVVPQAMGLDVRFDDGVGPIFDRPLETDVDVERLICPEVGEALAFVEQAIKILARELKVPLIGFCGAPFTLASYMIEGKTGRDFKKTKLWMLREKESFHRLLDKITHVLIDYLNLQIDAGAKALQIFDSWAWVLDDWHFQECAVAYLRKILLGLKNRDIPVIYFCRGSSAYASRIAEAAPDAISIDWNGNLKDLRNQLPHIGLQGNLDPDLLYAPKESLAGAVNKILSAMRSDRGFVFNLGHGIKPDTPVEAVKLTVEMVQSC